MMQPHGSEYNDRNRLHPIRRTRMPLPSWSARTARRRPPPRRPPREGSGNEHAARDGEAGEEPLMAAPAGGQLRNVRADGDARSAERAECLRYRVP